MAFENAKEYLAQSGLEDHIIVLDASSATVQLASEALGIEPERIAKTLSFMVDETPVLILMEGTARIDNHKYKEYFHKKAKMMSGEQLEEYVGHSAGGVCPFGIRDERVQVYLDVSLKKFETVYPACGSSNSAVCLSIDELEKCSGYREWIDVTKESV